MKKYTVSAKKSDNPNKWWVVDAEDAVLGRLATQVAARLKGKFNPMYTPHVDTGDYVIVTNARQVKLTGRKDTQSVRTRYTGYPGGLKVETFGSLRERKPEALIEDAVRRMLPKNRLGRVMLKKLKVYADANHPHHAQQPVEMKLS